jgi:hypothetical protein
MLQECMAKQAEKVLVSKVQETSWAIENNEVSE